jgi:hypothetical protein
VEVTVTVACAGETIAISVSVTSDWKIFPSMRGNTASHTTAPRRATATRVAKMRTYGRAAGGALRSIRREARSELNGSATTLPVYHDARARWTVSPRRVPTGSMPSSVLPTS